MGNEARKSSERSLGEVAGDDLISLLVQVERVVPETASQIDDRGIPGILKDLVILGQPIIANGPLRSIIFKYEVPSPLLVFQCQFPQNLSAFCPIRNILSTRFRLLLFRILCSKGRTIGIKSEAMQTKDHVLEFRVYLEDTDAQGIVYYANYLRFFERGRSEFLESLGIPMEEVARPDCRLVVYEVRLKFRRPAFLGNRIEVLTSMQHASEYRLTFRQQIRRRGEDEPLVSGEMAIVAIDQQGTLKELPAIFGPARP